MPTYEYECIDCNYLFDEFQRISDPPITICPSCNGRTKRIISGGTGFLFKGSGFYITDYRNKNYKASVAKENEPVSTPKSEPKTSGDNKK